MQEYLEQELKLNLKELLSTHLVLVYQRMLDTYAAHVIVRWTRSDSVRVIACFTFLPRQPRSHVNMAWDQGKRANVIT